MNNRIEFSVGWEDADQRLDRWMRRRHAGLVQARIEGLCRKGLIRINGRRAKPSDRLREGQTVQFPPITGRKPGEGAKDRFQGRTGSGKAGSMAGRVLFVDEHLVAIDKPPGLAVQGGPGQSRHIDRMATEFGLSGDEPPRLVHRLDKDTSGVLLMARSRRASAALSRQFRDRSLQKVYWAVVRGSLPDERGSIASPAGAAGPGMAGAAHLRQVAGGRAAKGTVSALTNYIVLETLGDRFSLVALNPVTGRNHQLRIHMAGLGTPIVGDRKHGGSSASDRAGIFRNRLHLHARTLEMRHPFTDERLELVAPLPAHLEEAFSRLGWNPDRYDAVKWSSGKT